MDSNEAEQQAQSILSKANRESPALPSSNTSYLKSIAYFLWAILLEIRKGKEVK